MSHTLKPQSQENILDKEQPAPSYLNPLKFLVKVSVGFFLLGVCISGKICEDDVSDLVEISYILILVECGFLAFFLICKYFPNTCLTCVSYYLTCYIFTDLLVDLFYLVWGVYFFIVYADEDHCQDQSRLSYAAKLTTLIYLIVFDSFIFCCCGAKLCMIFGTCCTAADTNKSSLSDKLLNKDEEEAPTTVKENEVAKHQKNEEKLDKKEKKAKKGKKEKKEKHSEE